MSNATYYLLWLAAGLAIVAIISAAITHRLQRRLMRRLKADELLDAVVRYSDWVSGQRRTLFFQAHVQEDVGPVQEIRALHDEWFPDLGPEVARLLAVHERLLAFLRAQQEQRLKDAEAWLEADHDAGFTQLWHRHVGAAQDLAGKLRRVTQGAPAVRERDTSAA